MMFCLGQFHGRFSRDRKPDLTKVQTEPGPQGRPESQNAAPAGPEPARREPWAAVCREESVGPA